MSFLLGNYVLSIDVLVIFSLSIYPLLQYPLKYPLNLTYCNKIKRDLLLQNMPKPSIIHNCALNLTYSTQLLRYVYLHIKSISFLHSLSVRVRVQHLSSTDNNKKRLCVEKPGLHNSGSSYFSRSCCSSEATTKVYASNYIKESRK